MAYKQATATCATCNYIKPRNEMQLFEWKEKVNTGSSRGINYSPKRNSASFSGRKYYRNVTRREWKCNACIIEEKRRREEYEANKPLLDRILEWIWVGILITFFYYYFKFIFWAVSSTGNG